MEKRLKVKVGSFKGPNLKGEGLEITVGSFITSELDEPEGPTPFPRIKDLRAWDYELIDRYPMLYKPFCDMCCYCTY
ncbi:MAG: hypothetical protein ACE5I5_20350, partial [Candidatus Heimdallarchaeota archaeon]